MGKALYRKYRSRSLSEVVGQEHITTTLSNALAAGKIAHAYLLTGPRGVGKTSIARILAHEINKLEYSEEPHFDIIEIDAASNNGVEDVRDLRDKIMSAPTSAAYKVFIIDEVHMLSKAAFNALLKTLEEPPAHVVFILATTEAHKLPETIISRTQRYSFRPASTENLLKNLRTIAQQESMTIDDDALQSIAKHSDGSFRDSVSLLDQASSISDHITKDQVDQLLGRASAEYIERLYRAIIQPDALTALNTLHELLEHGHEPAMIAVQLGDTVRADILAGSAQAQSVTLLRDLLDVPPAHNPKALLEIIVLSTGSKSEPQVKPTETPQPSQVKSHVTPPAETAQKPEVQKPVTAPVTEPVSTPQPEPKTPAVQAPAAIQVEPAEPATPAPASDPATPAPTNTPPQDIDALWHAVLQELKKTHNTLYGIARMATPELSGDTLTLGLNFAFHQKRLSEPRNIAIITKLTESIRQKPTTIRCIMAGPGPQKTVVNDAITNISNIFGGAELLES
jgi:DNA polymerase-3 subunit gamma/tau